VLPMKDRKTLWHIPETNALYLTLGNDVGNGNEVAGLFGTACIMEQSCLPNCHFQFDKHNGSRLTVRAARNIARGEHIATCYSNNNIIIMWGTQLRHQHLWEMKYFNCCCMRCVDLTELATNFSALRCLGTEDCGWQLSVVPLASS